MHERLPAPVEISAQSFAGVLEAARSGEVWAVEALWRDLHPRLLRYMRVLLPPPDVEDVVSDVWVEVTRGLGRFEGDWDAFRGWVFTIARLRLIDVRRKSRRRGTRPMEPTVMAGLIDATSPAADAVQRRDLEAVLGWLRRLPPDQAEVLLLRVLADLSCDQVAEVLGKRSGAVRALQHRAVLRLRKEMVREGVTPQRGDALWRSDAPLSV